MFFEFLGLSVLNNWNEGKAIAFGAVDKVLPRSSELSSDPSVLPVLSPRCRAGGNNQLPRRRMPRFQARPTNGGSNDWRVTQP